MAGGLKRGSSGAGIKEKGQGGKGFLRGDANADV